MRNRLLRGDRILLSSSDDSILHFNLSETELQYALIPAVSRVCGCGRLLLRADPAARKPGLPKLPCPFDHNGEACMRPFQ